MASPSASYLQNMQVGLLLYLPGYLCDALYKWQVSLEKKQGISQLELLCSQIELEERNKEHKKEMKRKKKKKSKQSKQRNKESGAYFEVWLSSVK